MIINFLYKMDEKNKRIITGMVVNDELVPYDEEHTYNLILEDDVKLNEGERIVSNYGRQYYGVLSDSDSFKCVNVNDFMLTVKLNLTTNLAYSTFSSKEMLDEIINETNNFNEQVDIEYVDAGYMLQKNITYKDGFEILFKKASDNVYIQLNYMKKPMFIGKTNGEYILTDDFSKAFRVGRKEIRPLLLTRGYVDRDVDRKDLAFSKFNCFTDGESYIFGGENSFMVSCSETNLALIKNPKLTTAFRLVNDETRAGVLRKICYLLKEEKEGKGRLFSINDRYLKTIGDLSYEFVENAALASVIDYKDIEIFKQVYLLFSDSIVFKTEKDSSYYCYNPENKNYIVSKEVLDFKSKAIENEIYDSFFTEFKEEKLTDEVVLISNDHYIEMIFDYENKFHLEFHESGFNATVFSTKQADILENIIGLSLKRKEITLMHDTKKSNNIVTTDKISSLNELYNDLLQHIKYSSIRLSSYPELDKIKTSSDKAALEYLRSLYPKCVMDAYTLFKRVLKDGVKRVLLVGTTSNADLEGLALACQDSNSKVVVSSLEPVKWGYAPKCEITSNVEYLGAYRLPFASLPKSFLENYDVIYFGKSYNESATELRAMISDLKSIDKDIFILNTKLCQIGTFSDPLYDALGKKVIRKKLKHSLEDYGLDNASMDVISYDMPIISNDVSYCSILKIGNNKLHDLLKK